MPSSKRLLFSLFLLPILASSQEWKPIKTVDLSQQPTAYSIDLNGFMYFGFKDGSMIKYDHEGTELINYSLSNYSSISLIEPQNSLKLFLFYYDIQQISLLDRFSTIPKMYWLRDFGIDLAVFACPTPDGSFWIIENNPIRLKKIDVLRQATLLEVQTTLGNQIRAMRVYQNLLIVSDEKGLHVFDQYGSALYSLHQLTPNYFQFQDGNIICYVKDTIYTIELSSGKVLKSIKTPFNEALGAFIYKDNFIFIYKKKLEYYSLEN